MQICGGRLTIPVLDLTMHIFIKNQRTTHAIVFDALIKEILKILFLVIKTTEVFENNLISVYSIRQIMGTLRIPLTGLELDFNLKF